LQTAAGGDAGYRTVTLSNVAVLRLDLSWLVTTSPT
jgi:hypothetical protein